MGKRISVTERLLEDRPVGRGFEAVIGGAPRSRHLYNKNDHRGYEVTDHRERSPTRVTPPDWDVAETWVSSLKAKGLKTASGYRDAVNGLLEFLGKPIADITLEDVLEYVGHLSESSRSRNTVALHVAAVRAFVQHCQGLGLLAQKPLDDGNRTTATTAWINRHTTHGEVERLLAAAQDVLGSHPLGRPGRTSIVLGIALPILLWIVSDEKTALGLVVLSVTMPLWIGAMRIMIHIGQWMLSEPEPQTSDPH